MIAHKYIDSTKAFNGSLHQPFGRVRRRELRLYGSTTRRPSAFPSKRFSFFSGLLVVEQYLGTRSCKHAHDGGADAARTSGHHGNFSIQGEYKPLLRHSDKDTEQDWKLASYTQKKGYQDGRAPAVVKV